MLLNKEALAASEISFQTAFNDELETVEPVFQEVASVVPSDSPVEQYDWIEESAVMKKWIGDREISKPEASNFQISNDDWANGIEVTRDDLRDDKRGMVAGRLRNLAKEGVFAMDDQVQAAYRDAFDGNTFLGYDGQPLVSDSHTFKANGTGTVQSNKGTAAFAEAAFEAGLVKLLSMVDHKGRKIRRDMRKLKLVVESSNWNAARKVINPDFVGGGNSNVNKGLVGLVLADLNPGEWFIIDTGSPVLPVILQVRQQPKLESIEGMSEALITFMRKKALYGADCTFGVGLGRWTSVYGSNGTT